jgi:hypothetical protein
MLQRPSQIPLGPVATRRGVEKCLVSLMYTKIHWNISSHDVINRSHRMCLPVGYLRTRVDSLDGELIVQQRARAPAEVLAAK